MPVATRDRVAALVTDFGSRAKAARAIGVDRSRVTRWLEAGEEPALEHRRRIDAIEFALSRLTLRYRRETALKWLSGFNAHLGNVRPIDLLRAGRTAEVLEAIEADETGAYA